MASFFDEIARNRAKSVLLMLLFGLLFAGVIYAFVILLGGGVFGFLVGIIIIIVYAAFSYHLGYKMVLKFSGAKEADKSQYSSLYNMIEGLSAAAAIPMPKVYIIQDPNPNAFATGRNKKTSAIAVTSGLLSTMDRDELTGVLAHETSHIANNDIQFMTIAVIFAGVIGLIAAYARMMFFFGPSFRNNNENGGIILLIALAIGLLAPLFAMLIRLSISRKREYMADANGARMTRAPMFLANALKKIQAYQNSPKPSPVKRANEVTAPMYFANPLSVKSISNLFSTHPPIEDRIKKLEEMY